MAFLVLYEDLGRSPVRYSFLRKTPADASVCKIFLFGHIAMSKAAPNLKSRSCHAVQRPTRSPRQHALILQGQSHTTHGIVGSAACVPSFNLSRRNELARRFISMRLQLLPQVCFLPCL